MMQHLLSLLIFVPIGAAVIALFIPSNQKDVFRYVTLGISLIQLVVLLFVFQSYHLDVDNGQYRLIESLPWITLDLGTWGTLKSEYFVALDGLSLPMVILSVFIILIATLSSWKVDTKVKGYFILLLILNGAIIGSFCALDFLLFYVFFEFMLLPMYFLIGIWGGPRREYASIKFFLYTLLGSILILIVMIGLSISVNDGSGQLVHSFSIVSMTNGNFIEGSILHPGSSSYLGLLTFRHWAFLLLFFGFAIKLPVVPLHTWLPDAHVEAPTPISIILAALLLKVGAYGLARVVWPIFPDGVIEFHWMISFIAILSIIYGAFNAMASKDLKRLIAYSSVSHMGFVLLGLASATPEGVSGAVYQLFSHGIISALLFALAGVLYDRTHDRLIPNYSGLATKMPVYFSLILVGFFASLGLPGFSGFIAEIMIFLGAFKSAGTNQLIPFWMAIVSTLGLILGASYYLWTIQRMFFGKFMDRTGSNLTDVDQREYFILIPLAIAALFFGIFPQPLIDIINPFAQQLSNLILDAKQSLNP